MKHYKIEQKAENMANKFGADATQADVQKVESKMSTMRRGPLAKIWNKVISLWDAFKSQETPTELKVTIIGSLIYMVSPIDVIPDVAPIWGLLDDVAVVGAVFASVEKILPKLKDVASSVVKTGVEAGVTKVLEQESRNLTPKIDRFVIRQWIKTGIQLLVFIIAVLILLGTKGAFWGMYVSSLLLLVTVVVYFIRACKLLPTVFEFFRNLTIQRREKLLHGKVAIKHAIIEAVFDHFHLNEEINTNDTSMPDNSETTDRRTHRLHQFLQRLSTRFSNQMLALKNKGIIFTVRAWENGKLDDYVPSDSELWNMIVHFFSRRVSAYILSVALYFVFFVWMFSRPVLTGLTGMTFTQFIAFPITAWFKPL